jgi:hypothetical protein
VEAQLTHLPLQVAGVRLAEGLGLLGEQANQEVDTTEVPIGQGLQPSANLWLDLHRVQVGHVSHGICIRCYEQPMVNPALRDPSGHSSWCAIRISAFRDL